MIALDFSRFEYVTFDCYGTLVDWETGILGALRPLLEKHDRPMPDGEILRLYSEIEPALQQEGGFLPYRAVLRGVVYELASTLGFGLDPGDDQVLVKSLGDWPVFADVPAGLAALKTRHRLGVLSNIDDDLFARTAPKLGVDLDLLVTAAQVESYKPGRAHFDAALERTGLTPDRILHVAESRFHDIAPARALGFTTVWINRASGRNRPAATKPVEVQPDLEFPTLEALVRHMNLKGSGE
jgi:2-haloacid dehalogenase